MDHEQDHPRLEEEPCPRPSDPPDVELEDNVRAAITAAALEAKIRDDAFWLCFKGGIWALTRWATVGKPNYTDRLIAMFDGARSAAGFEGDAQTWNELKTALAKGRHLVPRLKDYKAR